MFEGAQALDIAWQHRASPAPMRLPLRVGFHPPWYAPRWRRHGWLRGCPPRGVVFRAGIGAQPSNLRGGQASKSTDGARGPTLFVPSPFLPKRATPWWSRWTTSGPLTSTRSPPVMTYLRWLAMPLGRFPWPWLPFCFPLEAPSTRTATPLLSSLITDPIQRTPKRACPPPTKRPHWPSPTRWVCFTPPWSRTRHRTPRGAGTTASNRLKTP